MAQEVQGGDEVAPLDQLPQRTATEGILCDLEARLLGEKAQVDQDLMEGGKKQRPLRINIQHEVKMDANNFSLAMLLLTFS